MGESLVMKLGKLKLGKELGGPSGKKQNPIVIALIIVIIAGAGFFVVHNFMGGGDTSGAVDQQASAPPTVPTPDDPNNAPKNTAPPSAQAKAKPAPALPAAQKANAAKKAEPKQVKMANIKVFGAVGVNYPESWKINPSAANNAAVFTDGKAVLEVIPPDSKAKDAKAIATSALKSRAAGGTVASQGTGKVGNCDAYWYGVKLGGRTMRIVGIDGSTRVVLLEYAPSSQFASYRNVFNQIQSTITFSK